ncbi:MAG: T9SS type A sorting domain-containing protein, partial [Chitinophagales bacterium]
YDSAESDDYLLIGYMFRTIDNTGFAVGDVVNTSTGCSGWSAPVPVFIPALFPASGDVVTIDGLFEGQGLTYNTRTISIVGGTPPYSFAWDTEEYVRSQVTATNQLVVIYTDEATWSVSVTDANGCTSNNLIFSNILSGVNNSLEVCQTSSSPSAQGGTTGEIDLSVIGGTGTYTFELFQLGTPFVWTEADAVASTGTCAVISGSVASSDYTLSGLGSGWYYLVVDDGTENTEEWVWVAEANNAGGVRGKGASFVTAAPNPTNGMAQITFAADNYANVSVYDMTGRQVGQLFDGETATEVAQTVEFDSSNLPAGMYFVRLVTGTETQTIELMVTK